MPRPLRAAGTISLGALAVQLVVVVFYSHRQYDRFDLSTDFATYNQAVWMIAHGHLAPWSSVHSYPFLDDHFALITWVLALPYLLYPHGSTLLYIQDAAGVAAEVVVVLWVIDAVARWLTPNLESAPSPNTDHSIGTVPPSLSEQPTASGTAVRSPQLWQLAAGVVVVLLVVVLMVANPWFYVAMFFDFHTEALATLFAVGALRLIWKGRLGGAALWCIPLMACGDLAGIYLVGVGLSLLSVRCRQWWLGSGAIALGIFWNWLATMSGVSQNSFLTGYYYLESNHHVLSATGLILILATHPTRWIHVIWQRRSLLYQNIIPTGVLGAFGGWAWGAVAVVLLSSVLILPLVFIESGFQNLLAYIVGAAGCGLVLVTWLRRADRRWHRIALSVVIFAMVIQSVVFGVSRIPRLPSTWISVSPAQAKVLGDVLGTADPSTEMVMDWGVLGRFSQRPWIYGLYTLPETVPVHTTTVEFVLVSPQTAGNEPLTDAEAAQAANFLQTTLQATVIKDSDGIEVFRWNPLPGTTTVTIGT